MEAQQQITTLLLVLLSLLLLAFLVPHVSDLLSRSTKEADAFLRFAHLSQLYLRPISGEYNIFESNGTTWLYLAVFLRNEWAEPIYYRSPVRGVLYLKNEEGKEAITDVYFAVIGGGAFLPSVMYKLDSLSPYPFEGYVPYRLDLLVNGASIPLTLTPSDLPFSKPVYVCYSCISCQTLIDGLEGPAMVVLVTDVVKDKEPCLYLTGSKQITFDCSGKKIAGDGTGVVFYLSDANGYEVRNCYVKNVETAVRVDGVCDSVVRSVAVTSASYAIYLSDPLDPASYTIWVEDLMYDDKKLYYYKPGAGASYDPFLPLAIWVYGFSNVSIDGGGTTLSNAYPLLIFLNATGVSVRNLSLSTTDPYALTVLGSSDIALSDVNVTAHGYYGLYVDATSSLMLDRVHLTGNPSIDALFRSSDINLGDFVVR